jgi:zinc carboxypeptidase
VRKAPAGILVPALLALGQASLAPAPAVPRPESVLGFQPGADRKLADWAQIVDYFRRLDAASERVRVEQIGATTEGRPFLLVTISSEANMGRLEAIRAQNLRLADPRGLDEAEADRLVETGKTIVALNHGIHSDEVASPFTAMETAYALAAGDDPAMREVLDRTVVLMLPSQNPDGVDKVARWYREHLGTPFEAPGCESDCRLPFLYHHYTGHDDNRDWYAFTQVETRLTVRHLYDRWRPQIVQDLHEMSARNPRLFVPPYLDPWDPNVDPALRSASSALGTHIAARLTAEGRKGVVVHALYDAWSPSRAYPHTHGGVRILTECASALLASPIELKSEDLAAGAGYDARVASWNQPQPWPGGTWRLRDIVEYQAAATRALLEDAARDSAEWLRTFLTVNRRASARADPYAFVVSAAQHDPRAATEMLSILRTGGVEMARARAPFEAAGRRFPAGSHVIVLAQPASAFAKSVLERQEYPDIRQWPAGPPQRPYDVTAQTLPLLMGVDIATAHGPFRADLEAVAEPALPAGRIEGRGSYLAMGHGTAELMALGRLLRAQVPVRWATAGFTDAGRDFPAGTLLVPGSARASLEPLVRELGVVARGVAATPRALVLGAPRVGLYRSFVASIDEGWTRFVFERQVGVDYAALRDRDVRAGGLRRRFDVIVLPDQAAADIRDGHSEGSMPPEFTGGLGAEGVASLKTFVEEGGTLVALNGAAELALQELGLPVTDVLAGEAPGTGFYCPGAILKAQVEGTDVLTHGLDASTAIWFQNGPAFDVTGAGRALLRYPQGEPLLSGWLLGGSRLYGKAALVVVPHGRGRVVLFGFRPQYRAQSWGTYVPLLNAIYSSAARSEG